MSKQSMDNVLVAAKEVLGRGVVHLNAETQIRQEVLKKGGDSSSDGTLKALKKILGTTKINKKREEQIRKLANKVASGDKSGLDGVPDSNPVVEGDSIMTGAPKEGVNASQVNSFEAGNTAGGGEMNAPGSARSQIAAATNSGNNATGVGAGSPAVNNTSNNRV